MATYVPWRWGDIVRPTQERAGLLTHDQLRRIAQSERLQGLMVRSCHASPWYWLTNFCVTEDSHWVEKGLSSAFQRLPAYPYLQALAERWLEYPNLVIPKSRQVLVTWLIGCLYLGDALFLDGRLNMIQSKKEQDAQAVLARIRGVVDRMQRFAPYLVPKITKDDMGVVRFANGSSLIAVPQGKHHVQSYTPSGLFLDEAQLQEEAEESYQYSRPCCQRTTIVGSADFGWMYQVLLRDKIGEAA